MILACSLKKVPTSQFRLPVNLKHLWGLGIWDVFTLLSIAGYPLSPCCSTVTASSSLPVGTAMLCVAFLPEMGEFLWILACSCNAVVYCWISTVFLLLNCSLLFPSSLYSCAMCGGSTWDGWLLDFPWSLTCSCNDIFNCWIATVFPLLNCSLSALPFQFVQLCYVWRFYLIWMTVRFSLVPRL